jgi:hypothetical protein
MRYWDLPLTAGWRWAFCLFENNSPKEKCTDTKKEEI